jgi:predicted kinase
MTGRLVVVCGTPGVGKTTVARAVADDVGGDVLRTDVVRKELFDDPEYTDEEERRVYDELFARTREAVADGDAVVLDGTFYRQQYRREAETLAGDLEASFDLVKVECEESAVRSRIADREDDESDADYEVHELYRELFEPVEREAVVVDNSGTEAAARRQVASRFGAEAVTEERV